MEKKKHLGRGLQSLLGPINIDQTGANQVASEFASAANYPIDKELCDSLREISVEAITANPYQPRTVWDESELTELAESIRVNGVIQPILVRPLDGGFQVIAGERRLRAARIAGIKTIPAICRQATDEELLELALVENIHRSDLNPIERAKAYENYINTFSLTQAEAAEKLGENRTVVTNYLRLLDLPEEVKLMLTSGELSMGHARAILSLPTDDLRRKLANRAMAGRLSVREVERLVRKYLTGSQESSKAVKAKPVHIADLEKSLSGHLGTRVAIETNKSGQRGKIIIEFYSLEEFERITDAMGLASVEQV